MSDHSIAGTWKGHYSYRDDPEDGSGFEAVFYEDSKGVLEGHILDDEYMGQATISGVFSYPRVSFTKVYLLPGLSPVEYQGTMSGDGKSMSGTWIITQGSMVVRRGGWKAHRKDDERKKEETRQEEKITEKPLTVY